MKLPPYPKYKPSGVEWLGEVPAHWVTWKATHGFRTIGSGTTPKSDDPEYYDGNIPWVTTSELRETVIVDTTKEVTATAMHEYAALRMYPKGTLLFAMYGATIGRLGILGIAATVNQACAAFAEPLHLDTWFVYYWLQMRRPTLIVLSAGGGQPNLSQDDLRQLRIPAPTLDEQHAISEFLDRETAKIDMLISRKRTLIERLKEKRIALTSRTVTRGLPPDAATRAGFDPHPKLKPASLDWLGEVPKHWELGKFSHEVRIAEGQVDPEIEPYCSMILVAPNHIESQTGRLLAQETAADQGAISGKYFCRSGDVIYSKIRPALAKAVLAPEDCLCSADMYPMASRGRLRSRYLLLLLLSTQFTALSVFEADRVAMPKLNRETLSNLRMPVPPAREQEAIAEFLGRETAKIDTLVTKIETAVERLREYRGTLITAAVTGKIDIRGTVVPEEDAA